MADFPDDGYRSMVCIEAANAAVDIFLIPPEGEHTLSQTITEEPF
jgi:D-hexose-6-phosphate mutarotase